jgi:hypothetical protein
MSITYGSSHALTLRSASGHERSGGGFARASLFFPPSGVRVPEAGSDSFASSVTLGDVSASRRFELSYQQKVKA